MNLHIVSDSKFSNTFYNNLEETGLLARNKVVVRTNHSNLRYITHNVPFASLYSSRFASFVGDVSKYDKVFIHQFSPVMYRWVAWHTFRELNWMVWGGDLYNLPFVKFDFFEPLTAQYTKNHKSKEDLLYLLKVYLTNMPFRKKAYSKVDHVLTWMQSEYQFAMDNIPLLRSRHQFFFYENQVPYHQLNVVQETTSSPQQDGVYKIIIGNSGTPTNNHLDAVRKISESGIRADLFIPVSYGETSYINFLKKNVSFYKNGKIEFMDKFMEFNEYVRFLSNADALVMNHVRPQGYGNIFMMMYIGKPVFLNAKNISLPDLRKYGFQWYNWADLASFSEIQKGDNKEVIRKLLSHAQLVSTYRRLFA